MPRPFGLPDEQPARRWPHWLVALGLTSIAVPVGLGLLWSAVYVFTTAATLPDPQRAPLHDNPLATVVYAADGAELARYYRENRTPAAFEEISPHVVDALVATEDHRFYEHPGVDVRRLVAAAFETLRGRRQGGSTLTMQLVRNRYEEVAASPPLTRKLKEILMALKIERHYDKRSILESYLNTVPFGQRAFGIASAAHLYFGKKPAALNELESATLVGTLKATTRYDPIRHPERARQRRNVVLWQMVRRGHVSESFYAERRKMPLHLQVQPTGWRSSPAPHFAEHVRRRLVDWASSRGYDLYADGLRVYTTLDSKLQELANEAIQKQSRALQAVAGYEWSRPGAPFLSEDPQPYARQKEEERFTPFAHLWQKEPELLRQHARRTERFRRAPRQGTSAEEALTRLLDDDAFADSLKRALSRLEAGFVALDSRTGAVKAWVGSRSFQEDQYDHVAQARRQPGSTFKPFVYAAALDRGYAPSDVLAKGLHSVSSAVSAREGLTLREGLAYSSNRMATQLIREIGPSEVAWLARRLGIRSELRPVPSLALGTSEVTLLELASAYGTLAAHGMHHRPHLITRIKDRHGNILYENEPAPRKALSRYTAYTLLDMMRDVVDRGTGAALRRQFGIEADIAGKTGTTQNNADGWFLAAHPELVAGAWIGFNDRRIHFRTEHWGRGSSNALRVVGAFLRRAFASDLLHTQARFQPPPGYRAPQPLRTADTSGHTAAFVSDGESMRDAFALGLDSVRRPSPPDRLRRRDADPEAALRETLRMPAESDTVRSGVR